MQWLLLHCLSSGQPLQHHSYCLAPYHLPSTVHTNINVCNRLCKSAWTNSDALHLSATTITWVSVGAHTGFGAGLGFCCRAFLALAAAAWAWCIRSDSRKMITVSVWICLFFFYYYSQHFTWKLYLHSYSWIWKRSGSIWCAGLYLSAGDWREKWPTLWQYPWLMQCAHL